MRKAKGLDRYTDGQQSDDFAFEPKETLLKFIRLIFFFLFAHEILTFSNSVLPNCLLVYWIVTNLP